MNVVSPESTMDSYAWNKTNIFLNSLSGNYFPVKFNDSHRSTVRKIYRIFTWTMATFFTIAGSVVLIFIPSDIALRSNTACLVIVIEGMVITIYVSVRIPLLQKMVNEMEKIMIDNNTLKEAISRTLEPISKPIKIYVFCVMVAPFLWCGLNFLKLFSQDQFTYTDFNIPAYFPFEPCGKKTFVFITIVQIVGGFYLSIKKFGTDVYVIHIIALLTAQYKYLRNDLADIMDSGETRSKTIVDQYGGKISLNDRLRTWITHHQAVIGISRMLRDLTAPTVFVTFITSTFFLCFVGYMVIKIPLTFFENCIILMFGASYLIQLYMLCYCVQELLDSSTSVTTKAFHGEWFMRCQSIKNTFKTIIIADNIRSRLSAFGMVDLSLTTFTQIINHSYTGWLVLQKAASQK